MNKFGKFLLAFALAMIVGVVSINFAQTRTAGNDNGKPGMPHRGGRGGGFHPGMFEKLNLTDAQKTQIQGLLEANRPAPEQFEKVRAFDEQLKAVVQSGNFDEARAREILAAKSAAMIEGELSRLKTDAAIYNVLTAEQKTQLEQLKAERPERGGRGRRGNGGEFKSNEKPQN